MKDMFKIEWIWLKMPKGVRPSKYAMNNFFNGAKGVKTLDTKQIDTIKDIIDKEHKNAIAFLDKQKDKLSPKQSA